MPTVPLIPESAPFSTEQRAWLNGFLAGLLNRETGSVPAAGPAAESKPPLLIAYGSQSGNAECLAKRLGREAAGRGFATQVASLDSLQAADLPGRKNLLLITSTWGEGDMPDNAASFWEALNRNGSSPKLAGLNYTVLALGDRNYPDTFCLAGRKLDERLDQLGATRIYPRVDCDVEFDALADEWSAGALTALLTGSPAAGAVAPSGETSTTAAEPEWSRKRPFPAPLLANQNLNGPGSAKDTHHIVFSLAGSGMAYETGDALGVLPQNDPALVEAVLEAHGFDGNRTIAVDDGPAVSLRDALLARFEIRHLKGRPGEPGLTPEAFLAPLKKLQPRLYSIASSQKAHPDEVHLCVGAVRYEKDGVHHQGTASTFLSDRLAIGQTAGVFVHTAGHFRVPSDGATPIIMVGPGTGIAPFRAFLQERQATGAPGKNWLFFGDQRRQLDFLYRSEILAWVEQGHLTRLDTAFSRDQEQKVYVQDRMMESGEELWRWLEEGAHFYVCGDASRMAKDVDTALHRIVERHGRRSTDDAVAYVAALKKSKRYARDVY